MGAGSSDTAPPPRPSAPRVAGGAGGGGGGGGGGAAAPGGRPLPRPPQGRAAPGHGRPLRRDEGGPGRLLPERVRHQAGSRRVGEEDPAPRGRFRRGAADLADVSGARAWSTISARGVARPRAR